MALYSNKELASMFDTYGNLRDSLKDFKDASTGSSTEYKLAQKIVEDLLPECRKRISDNVRTQLEGLEDESSLEAECKKVIDDFKGI